MPLHAIAFGSQKRVFCTDLFRIENAKQAVAAAAIHTATIAAVSSYGCSSLPWSKLPNDQSLGLGSKKNVAGCRLACSQNKWYSDATDASIGARLCVGCSLSGGLGVTWGGHRIGGLMLAA